MGSKAVKKDIPFKEITMAEIDIWCQGTFGDLSKTRLLDILTGEYSLDDAREDVLSFKPKKKEEE